MKATFIFPNQLFPNHPSLSRSRKVFIIQDPLFFGDYKYKYRFHKNKILLHLLSIDAYHNELLSKGYDSNVITHENLYSNDYLINIIKSNNISHIHFCDPVDYLLHRRIDKACMVTDIQMRKYETPGFLLSDTDAKSEFSNKKPHLMASFYKRQRKRYNILIDEEGFPEGGKWSFDIENRKRMPKKIVLPKIQTLDYKKYKIQKKKEFVRLLYSDNPGSMRLFNYPISRSQATSAFHYFLETRFSNFGNYEDAIVKEESFLFHGIVTPYLNIGLLTPQEIINDTIDFAKENSIPLNSVEGFIRQIIGWREFMRGIYIVDGTKQRNSNFWRFNRQLPNSFYNGTTGIDPLDYTIKKVLENAYAHHIERLMVLGNLMLLLEIEPNSVYKWFMELFIDSYDWVMVPNVYGMSQFSDGGLLATKPYISGSNYILKMSNYKKGPWCQIWDSLFWRFIKLNRDYFIKNPRMSMMVSVYDRKNNDQKLMLNQTADDFIRNLFHE